MFIKRRAWDEVNKRVEELENALKAERELNYVADLESIELNKQIKLLQDRLLKNTELTDKLLKEKKETLKPAPAESCQSCAHWDNGRCLKGVCGGRHTKAHWYCAGYAPMAMEVADEG